MKKITIRKINEMVEAILANSDLIIKKRCRVCNQEKYLEEFHNDNTGSGGKHKRCKQCKNDQEMKRAKKERINRILSESNLTIDDLIEFRKERMTINPTKFDKYTAYGECPSCGRSCQPDVVGGTWTPDQDLEEYAVCCICQIMWTYFYPADERDKWNNTETYERIYKPLNIEAFDDSDKPYECE